MVAAPAGYALVGAASLTCGVTRSISTAIITLELTGQWHHLFPIFTATIIAYAVGNVLTASFYEVVLALKGTPSLPKLRREYGADAVVLVGWLVGSLDEEGEERGGERRRWERVDHFRLHLAWRLHQPDSAALRFHSFFFFRLCDCFAGHTRGPRRRSCAATSWWSPPPTRSPMSRRCWRSTTTPPSPARSAGSVDGVCECVMLLLLGRRKRRGVDPGSGAHVVIAKLVSTPS